VVDPTGVDVSCVYCDPTEMAYHDGTVVVYCRECKGRPGKSAVPER